MPKNGNNVKFKNLERKLNPPFTSYVDLGSTFAPEDNGKPNPEEDYMTKYPKHIGCSYGYKSVYIIDKFSAPFKTYLGQKSDQNFISSMIEESRYCSEVMKNKIAKNL